MLYKGSRVCKEVRLSWWASNLSSMYVCDIDQCCVKDLSVDSDFVFYVSEVGNSCVSVFKKQGEFIQTSLCRVVHMSVSCHVCVCLYGSKSL